MNRLLGIFFMTSLVISPAVNVYSSPYSQYVEISGRKADVDLSDIIRPEKSLYDEADLKKICVDITDRYHSLGYTAFRIRKAVLKKDGSVSLEFLEPAVEEISVTGAGSDENVIQGEIYTRGAVFNELLLAENMKQLKEKLSLRRLSVNLKKLSEDRILINVTAVKRIINFGISAGSSLIYGAISNISFDITSGYSVISAEFETTAWIKDAYYNKGILSFKHNAGDSFFWLFTADYKNSSDYSDNAGASVYKSESSSAEIFAGYNHRAVRTEFGLSGEYSYSNQLAGFDKGLIFSGITCDIGYDDKAYRIDPLDNMAGEIKWSVGRNYIEENISSRLETKGKISIPVSASASLVAGIDFRYTSEDDRYFHEYVFDNSFPVRRDDFIASQWRTVSEVGVMFDLYNRVLFLSPAIAGACYDYINRTEDVYSACLKLIMNSPYLSGEIVYSCEIKENPGSGVLGFSANAVF